MIDKKELKKQYKQTVQPMGVYQIRNLINGKIFIGSSKNLHAKSNSFRFQLNAGLHINKKLQHEYSQFGDENFVLEVLDYLKPKEDIGYDYTEDLKVLEDLWIEKLAPFDERGYN